MSPDGTRVAFMEHPIKFDDRGWVKVVDRSGKVTIVAGDFPAEEGVAWSRDGRSVLFGAFVDYQMAVLAAPARGGGPLTTVVGSAGSLTLHDVAPDGRVAVSRETFRYGVAARGAGQDAERDLAPHDQAWSSRLSRDGRFLFLTDGRGGHDYAVVRRGVDGSPPARLGDGNTRAVSADGRWVTATLYSTGRCAVYPTGTGAMVPVPMGPLETCQSATFFPDGKSLLLVGNEPGKPTRAYRAAFPGGTPEAILPAGLAPVRISASGRRLLVQDSSRAWQVVEIGGASSPVRGLLGTDVVVEWSDDEQELIVTEDGKVPAPIDRVRLDTGARTRLGEMGPADRVGLIEVEPTAFRDGGRQYAYDYSRSSSELYLVSAPR
mgnify:FL=1